jgi:hypothetical protein
MLPIIGIRQLVTVPSHPARGPTVSGVNGCTQVAPLSLEYWGAPRDNPEAGTLSVTVIEGSVRTQIVGEDNVGPGARSGGFHHFVVFIPARLFYKDLVIEGIGAACPHAAGHGDPPVSDRAVTTRERARGCGHRRVPPSCSIVF